MMRLRCFSPLLFALVPLLACSTHNAPADSQQPDPNSDDDLMWGGGKADSYDEASSEALLDRAIPRDNAVACANATGAASATDDGSAWQELDPEGGHFRIMYRRSGPDRVVAEWLDLSPHNGHPDFVDEVAKGATQAYQKFHDELGYGVPVGPTVIYIKDAKEYFGYESGGAVVVDNDSFAFKISRHFLRATVAHEYFHVLEEIQAGSWGNQDEWLTESSAVWAEQQATGLFDGFVGGFIRDVLLSDRLQYGIAESWTATSPARAVNYPYASFLFEQFLVEKYGDPNIVRELFAAMRTNSNSLDAARAVLANRGTTFEDEFMDLCAWNYLVGNRDDGQHYHDGKQFFHGLSSSSVLAKHSVPVDWQESKSPPDIFAVNYVEFDIPNGSATVSFEVEANQYADWRLSTLAHSRDTGSWVALHQPIGSGPSRSIALDNASNFDRAVLIVGHLGAYLDVNVSRLPLRYRATAQ